MVVVGELLLSAFFQTLFSLLTSRELINFVRQLGDGVDSELKIWEDTLTMIQAVLSDAEEKQLTVGAVRMWLNNLRDLAYDAEDILDEVATKALESKLRANQYHQPSTSKAKIQSLLPACFNQSTVMFNASMRSRIKDITDRLDRLCKQRIDLGLQLTPGGSSSTTAVQQRLPSSSVPTERAVLGRDEDKAKILDMVLSHESSDANFRVIPIVGMAGVGKTTLAREVYNDKAVKNFKFDIQAWIFVSDDFDVLGISKALLESITSASCDLKALNEIQIQLKKVVDGKKILLVLDDVWNEDYGLWEDLKAPFLAAAPSSKIIVTTRHSHVASIMDPIQQYNLQRLSDDDCWCLFMMHAFEGRNANLHQVPEIFHDKVVRKCGGLPLAAKTLGGLLRTKSHDAWEDILDSKMWDLSNQGGILPVLRLSYHHLPSHLKRCFTYSAIFPKDYEFMKKELVLLWIAEGIIQQPGNNKQIEHLGNQCFQDLVSRSIFEQSSGDSSKFVIHDLVHDLAQFVSGETIFRLEEGTSKICERVRHLSYSCGRYDGKNRFEGLYEVEHLRTFLPKNLRGGWTLLVTSYINNTFLSAFLSKFKKLRVLSLEGYHITELSISFEDLRSLRYLNLAGSEIRSLPESTSSLLNMQILILSGCYNLKMLPSKMRNLIQLRHLDIKGANSLKEMPLGMKDLKDLQMLSNFIVGKGKVSTLKDLKILNFLGGELCITGLENVDHAEDAREAMLYKKQNLEALSLQWGSQFDSSRNEDVEKSVLEVLQPNRNIKKLMITNYGGKSFPSWVGDPSFSNLIALELRFCKNCISLPPLGMLASLKDLTIVGVNGIKSIGSEIYGKDCSQPFQSLETLRFEDLKECEFWDTNTIDARFSSLRELSIVECPKLSGKLPEVLPSLEMLVASKCGELVVSFSSYPMLCKLKIDECKGLVCLSPTDSKLIESMTISSSLLQISGCKGMIYNDCPSGDYVTISNVLEFGKILNQGFQQVEALGIGDSARIKSWRIEDEFHFYKPEQGFRILSFPEEVLIEESCLSLVSFPEINIIPNNLRSLMITKVRAIKSLPEEIIGNNSQLEFLGVIDCDSLLFIGRRKLPSSLRRLEIENCKNLQHLVDGEDDGSSSSCSSAKLKYLQIWSCPELIRLSSGIQLLEAMEVLSICDCLKLESISDGLYNLQEIFIWNCPSFVSFPERGLPNTISILTIHNCEKLEALPKDMHKLNSLKRVDIMKCPSLSFPEEGFHTSLTLLRIDDDKLYKSLIRWGLHSLTSLTFLSIGSSRLYEAECFLDEETGVMLPSSLTSLFIVGFSKLKHLSSMGFQCLTSLESLVISECPNLTSFPEVGLPSSLMSLTINNCPKLKKQCRREKGKEWSKIAHLPSVYIDHKNIYDPEELESENHELIPSL